MKKYLFQTIAVISIIINYFVIGLFINKQLNANQLLLFSVIINSIMAVFSLLYITDRLLERNLYLFFSLAILSLWNLLRSLVSIYPTTVYNALIYILFILLLFMAVKGYNKSRLIDKN